MADHFDSRSILSQRHAGEDAFMGSFVQPAKLLRPGYRMYPSIPLLSSRKVLACS